MLKIEGIWNHRRREEREMSDSVTDDGPSADREVTYTFFHMAILYVPSVSDPATPPPEETFVVDSYEGGTSSS